MWQKQLKTTLQDVLGQLLKYGVAWTGLTPMILCARTRSRRVYSSQSFEICSIYYSILLICFRLLLIIVHFYLRTQWYQHNYILSLGRDNLILIKGW